MNMKVCMIAGDAVDYVFSLVQALARLGVHIELLGGDDYENPKYAPLVTFVNIRGSRHTQAAWSDKLTRVLRYYGRLMRHVWRSEAQTIHIQAFRFAVIEGLGLVFIFKRTGKRVIYTAHNVQPKGSNNGLNYFLFRLIYMNVDHIVCHSNDMQHKLMTRYRVRPDKITVAGHGLFDEIPMTLMAQGEARRRLGLDPDIKVVLLFGRIRPYKGYELAFQALEYLPAATKPLMYLVAGEAIRSHNQKYLAELKTYVRVNRLGEAVRFDDFRIPEAELDLYFQAADAALLPYTEGDFQSGVLFLAYRFGLPVITSNVGSFPDDVVSGVQGYIFEAGNPRALAASLDRFYQCLHPQADLRQSIRAYTRQEYSWEQAAAVTYELYQKIARP
ncbi:glycosyltransferase family 4 protein [Candidatus Entotheonella palauensis]|uniref:glycosyltransferase family 4 protein n=1 Tax=Candidatus Entotheonella palauensis TaxID=93172 RepID=UPI000B7CA0C4|nr:glycosyltransferase family 4 protein [Candidatus Entotheonella palauensis]